MLNTASFLATMLNTASFLADITKKVPIYVHFVEKLHTFDLRALGGSFVENMDGGQFILFYDRGASQQF